MSRRVLTCSATPVVIVTSLALWGCGGSHAKPANEDPTPSVGIDRHLNEPVQWISPKLSRQADGGFVAQLSPDASSGAGAASGPVTVRLGGVGWPDTGKDYGLTYVGSGVLSKWNSGGESYSVALTTDARRVSLFVWNLGGRFQVRVDSTTLGTPRSVGTSYHHHTLDVAFSTTARRTITFELAGAVYFSGVSVGGGDERVSVPTVSRSAPPSVYWLGDSYVAGGGATHPGFDDLVHFASERAGLTDVTVDALGGTGYLRTNAAADFPDYLTRARVNLGGRRARPHLIVVGGSINDAVYPEAQVRQAAGGLYRFLARALPDARVVVVPFTSVYPVPGPIARANKGILSAARAAPNVVGALDLPARVLALGGSAGGERESGALVSTVVKYHPSEAGQRLYGRIIGTFLADCLQTLKRKGPSPGVCDRAS